MSELGCTSQKCNFKEDQNTSGVSLFFTKEPFISKNLTRPVSDICRIGAGIALISSGLVENKETQSTLQKMSLFFFTVSYITDIIGGTALFSYRWSNYQRCNKGLPC